MTKLGELLSKNEQKFISLNPHLRIKASSWWLSLFSRFTFAGDLVDYILTEKSTNALKNHEEELKSCGFSTMKMIVEKYCELYPRESSQRISFSGLIRGAHYTSRDICALAKNQNENLGMYMGELSNGKTVALLKATIDGNKDKSRKYPDQWLDDSHTKIKYCLQREKNTIDFEFSKKENKAIFDGLTYNLPVPIYLFANNIGDKDYIFEGIFQANSLSLDRQSFNLVLQDKITKLENFKEYFEYINRYKKVDFNEIALRTDPLKEVPVPMDSLPALKRDYPIPDSGNPDYLELLERFKILGNFGEEKALQFERNRVAEFDKDLANRVCKVPLDKEGYDIASFNKGIGGIQDIKIEVKTTANSNGLTPFFMSANECRVMINNIKNYWLYRIFNVHSTMPSLFRITENVYKSINLEPLNYLCHIKTI